MFSVIETLSTTAVTKDSPEVGIEQSSLYFRTWIVEMKLKCDKQP